jgi:4-amino-4-deoxy-L-arabinose transferase-like glycosyltransferase
VSAWRDRRFAWQIALFALLVRLLFLFVAGLAETRYDALYDDQIYADLARGLLAGRGFAMSHDYFVAVANHPTSIVHPVYPVLLAASYGLFGDVSLPFKLLQAVFGALTVLVVYGIGRQLFSNERAARVAAAIASVYPLLVVFVRPLITETLFTLLLSCLVYATLACVRRPSWRAWFGLGLLWGVCYLTRGESLAYGAVLAAWAAFEIRRSSSHRGRWASFAAAAALGLLLLVVPWTIRNAAVHGVPLVTENKLWNVWEANQGRYLFETSPATHEDPLPQRAHITDWDSLDEFHRDRRLLAGGLTFVRQQPRRAVWYAITRVLHSYPILPREIIAVWRGQSASRVRQDGLPLSSIDEFPTYQTWQEQLRVWPFRFIALFAAIGVLRAWRGRNLRPLAPLLALVLINMSVAAAVYGKERFRVPIEPYLILLAMAAIWPRRLQGRSL